MLAAPSMDILASMAKGQLIPILMVLLSIHMALLPAMLDVPSMDTQDMARGLLKLTVLCCFPPWPCHQLQWSNHLWLS